MFTLTADTAIPDCNIKPSDCQITGFFAHTKTGLQAIYYCDGCLYYFGTYTNIPHLVECPEILDKYDREHNPDQFVQYVLVNNTYASPNCDCPYRLQRLGNKVSQAIVRPVYEHELKDTTKDLEHWENQTQYAYAQACVLPNRKLTAQGMYYYIQ